MLLPALAIVLGLALLFWSADRFVEGASITARHLGMPPLLIGMLVVGFGTSAPEMIVSALGALQDKPGIALGNAYGSNITNIALILGTTALIGPIAVQSGILRRELPVLVAVTGLAAYQLIDGELSRSDAWILLGVFALLVVWSIQQGRNQHDDPLATGMSQQLASQHMSIRAAVFWLLAGLLLLIVASRVLVWGAIEIAQNLGVSDLVIGLTVIAIGTSLPELASSIIAARKGEHDIALGNILGSNLFNTLAVVGIAGVLHPMAVPADILPRDMPVMALLTLSLFVIGRGIHGKGRINRIEGAMLLAAYVGYTGYLIAGVLS